MAGGATSVANAGQISGNAAAGALNAGGILTNSGVLVGATNGVNLFAAGTVVNTGSIAGSGDVGVYVDGAAGTVINAGTISGPVDAVAFVGSFADRVILDPGAVFDGTVAGGSGTNTPELASAASTGTLPGVPAGSLLQPRSRDPCRAQASRHLLPLVERAIQVRRQRADPAKRLCLEVLELSPGQPDMLWMMSRLREAAQPAATEALVGRIVAVNPNHIPATQDLALRLLRRGALAEAETHACNAVRIAPNEPQSHNLLGMVLTEAHQPRTGEFHYQRVLELSGGRDPILLANLAWCLKLQGRMTEDRALYEESVAAAPEVFQTLLGWERLEEADGQSGRAAELLNRAERPASGHSSLRLLRAVLHGRTEDHAAALTVLEGISPEAGAGGRGEAGLGPEKLLEKGRLSTAWDSMAPPSPPSPRANA